MVDEFDFVVDTDASTVQVVEVSDDHTDLFVIDDSVIVEVGGSGSGGGGVVIGSTNYSIEITSTNGQFFRPGQVMTTTLVAHVFHEGVEVTDQLEASRFEWKRQSYYEMPAPDDDATWNLNHASGYKQITINAADVYARATYTCNIREP